MIFKCWYIFSLLLLVYSLCILDDEANSVYYNRKDSDETFKASFCFPLDNVLRLMGEKQRIEVEQNQTIFVPRLMKLAKDSLNRAFGIKLAELHSYFTNNHTCFIVSGNKVLRNASYFQSIDFRVFASEVKERPFFYEAMFLHKNNNLNFHELILEKVEVQYKSTKFWKCEHDPRMENGMNYTFYNCLNDCLKKSAKKTIYLYESTESVYLNLSDDRRDVPAEEKCIKNSCNRESCLMTSYNSFHYNDRPDVRVGMKLFKYEARFLMENLDCYLQLFGVIALFLNVSFVQLLSRFLGRTTRAAFNILNIRSIRLDRLTKGLRLFVIIFSLCLLCLLSYLIAIEFYQNLKQPPIFHHFLIEPRSFQISIVLCAPVQSLINANAVLSSSTESALLENSKFEIIEELTNAGLDKLLELPIYVSYPSMRRRLNYTKSASVLFVNGTYELEQQTVVLLERCFRIEFDHKEAAYERYLLSAEIVLQTKNDSRAKSLYLVLKEAPFLWGAFQYKASSKMHMYETERSAHALDSNCEDYSKRPDLDCGGQKHCIEKCIAANFLSNYSSITTRVVIEKSELAQMSPDFNRLNFNRTPDLKIEQDCREKYRQVDCLRQEICEGHGYGHREPGEYRINLYHVFVYDLQLSEGFEKLALKFLNCLSILYGLNIKKILNFALSFSRFRSTYKKLCERTVFLLVLTGFAYNVFLVFDGAANGPHVATGTFTKPNSMRLPDIVFCLNILHILPEYEAATEHHQVTGRYLDELTANYTMNSILKKLVYLDKKNKFTEFTGEEQELFTFQSYMFLNLKCWQISINITYHLGDFYCLNETYLVRFYLNRSALPEFFYFGYKRPDAKEFTDLFKLSSNERVNRKIKFENFEETEVEKFRFLKYPLAWLFYERFYGMTTIASVTAYLDKLKNDFKSRFNLTTRRIVLEHEHYDYEIEEALFNQYYEQVQRQIDEAAKPQVFANFKSYDFNIIDQLIEPDDDLADFEIFSNFFSFRTFTSNSDNLVKFVQDLLNALSFCLSISILDLHVCISKSIELIVAFYERLQKARSCLVTNLRL